MDGWAALDGLYVETRAVDRARRRAAPARRARRASPPSARSCSRGAPRCCSSGSTRPRKPPPRCATRARSRPTIRQLADLLVTALVKAGRDREAAAILEGRIAALERDSPTSVGHSRGELAALHIRLAQLRNEQLGDRDRRARGDRARARRSCRSIRPRSPCSPTSHRPTTIRARSPMPSCARPTARATTTRRIAALMAAGDVLLDARRRHRRRARPRSSACSALRPYHADATWALAGLVEKGGDPETAARVLEKRLEDESLTPPEKARIMTQLAALSRAAGVEPAAERRLLEALGCVPDHIPAIVALADFYADADRWNDLEAFLREVLDGTLLAAAPAALDRRSASPARRARTRSSAATRTPTRRWSPPIACIAATCSSSSRSARTATRRGAGARPRCTCRRSRRTRTPRAIRPRSRRASITPRSPRFARCVPRRRRALYARALELKPSYAPALQALAEIAMEQGDHRTRRRSADAPGDRDRGARRAHAPVRGARRHGADDAPRRGARAHLLRRRGRRRAAARGAPRPAAREAARAPGARAAITRARRAPPS